MIASTRHVPFETTHAVVPLVCLAGELAVSMLAVEPVCATLSLAGALAASLVLRGSEATARSLRQLLPWLLLVCLLNPVFSPRGSTILARILNHPIYLESIAYGACMGTMLAAVLLWVGVGGHMLAPDRLMTLSGRTLPTITVMASMTGRLIPQLLRRGRLMRSCELACSAAAPATMHARVAAGARRTTTLMAWSLEDSVVRADVMRARGWESGAPRTSWQPTRFGRRDLVATACLAVLVTLALVATCTRMASFSFYPVMGTLGPWWSYLPAALLAGLPAALDLGGRVRWSR
jgi:energy-coupling factor transport system permease protein